MTSVNKSARAARLKQKPSIIWFTGLSGAGKSSSAYALEQTLFASGCSTYVLDGDNIRQGLCANLAFSDADRAENIRRVGEVAKLMVDAGLIVLVSAISPFRRERELVRKMVEDDEFIEVYVKTPLAICEARDPKGLYKKARAGEIRNFTGISSTYEPPERAEIEVDTSTMNLEASTDFLLDQLAHYGIVK